MSKITVYVEGNPIEVDCSDGKCTTYSHLKERLQTQGVAIQADHYFEVADGDDDDGTTRVEDEAAPIAFDRRTDLKLRKMEITIREGGQEDVLLSMVSHATIKDVKQAYFQQTNTKLEKLTSHGDDLAEEDTLYKLGLPDGAVLMGRFSVSIRDLFCDTEHLVDVYETDTAERVLRLYEDKSQRRLFRPSLWLNNDEIPRDQPIHQSNVAQDSTLDVKTKPFSIDIKYKKDGKEFSKSFAVADHYTGRMIKDAFSRDTGEVTEPGDRLLFDRTILTDDDMLFKAHVVDGSILSYVKEDIVQTFRYVCAGTCFPVQRLTAAAYRVSPQTVLLCSSFAPAPSFQPGCGTDVRLKKLDVVRCRICGYRIVYKTRARERTCRNVLCFLAPQSA